MDDGYVSDYTTNTQNSEGTYALPPKFNVKFTEFDTTTSVNYNGEMNRVQSQHDLNVNTAAALKSNGVLHNQQKGQRRPPRVLPRSSKVSTDAVVKTISSE